MASMLCQLCYGSYTSIATLWQPKNHFILPSICDWASSSFSILLSIALTLLANVLRYSFWFSTILSSLDIQEEIKGNKIKTRKTLTKIKEINDKFPNFAQQDRQLKLEGRFLQGSVRYASLDVESDLLNCGRSFNSIIFLFSTFLMCSVLSCL